MRCGSIYLWIVFINFFGKFVHGMTAAMVDIESVTDYIVTLHEYIQQKDK